MGSHIGKQNHLNVPIITTTSCGRSMAHPYDALSANDQSIDCSVQPQTNSHHSTPISHPHPTPQQPHFVPSTSNAHIMPQLQLPAFNYHHHQQQQKEPSYAYESTLFSSHINESCNPMEFQNYNGANSNNQSMPFMVTSAPNSVNLNLLSSPYASDHVMFDEATPNTNS